MILRTPKTSKQKEVLAVQMRQYQKQQAKLQEIKSAPLLPVDPNLPICVVIDIDGVLAKKGDRGTYDFNKSIVDSPFHQIVYILRLIDDANKWQNKVVGKTHIILLTGREEQYKDVTNQWLNTHQIPFDMLLMRRTADKRSSEIVKEEIYAGTIRGKYNVLFVIEDTKKNIDKFRSLGLYCIVADNSRE